MIQTKTKSRLSHVSRLFTLKDPYNLNVTDPAAAVAAAAYVVTGKAQYHRRPSKITNLGQQKNFNFREGKQRLFSSIECL